MAGVLEQLIGPFQRRPRSEPKVIFDIGLDRKVIELETAKEILQEVFATSSAEVEEMIRLRLEDRDLL